jgi:antirestriction protein ArdC
MVWEPDRGDFLMARRFAPRRDIPSPAQTITDAIIARLEAGAKPWVRPWTGQARPRPLRYCGTPYRGANFLWLGLVADMMGYSSPYWMTYRQSALLGGQVRKGEKATIAILYKSYQRSVEDPETGDERTEERRMLRSYPVFCADQIDHLPERYHPMAAPVLDPHELDAMHLADLRSFFNAIPAEVRHGGQKAFYHPAEDYIQLPTEESFHGYPWYAAIRCHELGHWSGAEHRLDRQFGKRFGDKEYCVEELCAELISAILGAELNLPVALLDNHANYINDWISFLKSDARALLSVASRADEGASYLLGLGGRGTDPETEPDIADADNDIDERPLRNAA